MVQLQDNQNKSSTGHEGPYFSFCIPGLTGRDNVYKTPQITKTAPHGSSIVRIDEVHADTLH